MKKIIVMSGSFNPPTIAHYYMMKFAVEQLQADRGVFIPVSQIYLRRKMRKSGQYGICIDAQKRLQMVYAMCQENPQLVVDEMEMESAVFSNDRVMGKILEQYPNAELYFLVGADNLDLIAQWSEEDNFLEHYHVIVFYRDGDNPKEKILSDNRLRNYEERIVLFPKLEETDGISSTNIRKYLIEGEKQLAKNYFHEKAWDIFESLEESDYPQIIESFKGEYEYLNNSFPVKIEWRNQTWSCVESAYQAARCSKNDEFLRFVKADAQKAKQYARKIQPREDWEDVKVQIMEEIVTAKFLQHPELAEKLKNTGNMILVAEKNNIKDTFCEEDNYSGKGENQLGKLLMRIREQYYINSF